VYFSQLLNGKEKWRGLRSRSAGRWARELERKLVFGAVSWPSGSRPSSDGRDLAIHRNPARAPLRLCVEGWVGCFVRSSCLRVCDGNERLCGLCASAVFRERVGWLGVLGALVVNRNYRCTTVAASAMSSVEVVCRSPCRNIRTRSGVIGAWKKASRSGRKARSASRRAK
jgi:hypothetical protein